MKTDFYAARLHRAEFQAIPLPNGDFELSLHIAAPTGAEQTEHELKADKYQRARVPRTHLHWNVGRRRVSNAYAVTFDAVVKKATTITHLGIGTAGVLDRVIRLEEPLKLLPGQTSRVLLKPGEIRIDEAGGDKA